MPRLVRSDRVVRLSRHSRIAAQAGFADWQPKHGPVVRILFYSDPVFDTFHVMLPAPISRQEAETWFEQTVDALGWQLDEIHSAPAPGGVSVWTVCDSRATQSSPGVFSAGLDTALLRSRLLRVTTVPAVLAVTLRNAHLLASDPRPARRARDGGAEILFYRLGSGPRPVPATLTLRYGPPVRWLAALLAAIGLCLLLPFALPLALREHFRRRTGVEPRARLRGYFGLWYTVLLATWATGAAGVWMLGQERLYMWFNPQMPVGLALLTFQSVTFVWLGMRLLGLPLERDAYPEKRAWPWYRLAVWELACCLGMVVLIVLVSLFAESISGSRGSPIWIRAALCGLMLFMIGFLLMSGTVLLRLRRRRQTGLPRGEREAPSDLVSCVRALSGRLNAPVRRVLLARFGPLEGHALSIQVCGDVAVLAEGLSAMMAPEDAALLVVAALLARPRSRLEPLLDDPLLPLGYAAVWCVVLLAGFQASDFSGFRAVLGFTTPLLIASVLSLMLLVQRRLSRQEAADLRVAESLEDPVRFTRVLRQDEEFRAKILGLDPEAGGATRRLLCGRRLTLEHRLGIE